MERLRWGLHFICENVMPPQKNTALSRLVFPGPAHWAPILFFAKQVRQAAKHYTSPVTVHGVIPENTLGNVKIAEQKRD